MLGYWVGGIDLVWLTGGWLGDQQLKVLTVFTSVALCVCHAVTIVFVKERVLIESADDGLGDDGEVGSTVKALRGIWVTFKTLPKPIQQILNVQVCPPSPLSFPRRQTKNISLESSQVG